MNTELVEALADKADTSKGPLISVNRNNYIRLLHLQDRVDSRMARIFAVIFSVSFGVAATLLYINY